MVLTRLLAALACALDTVWCCRPHWRCVVERMVWRRQTELQREDSNMNACVRATVTQEWRWWRPACISVHCIVECGTAHNRPGPPPGLFVLKGAEGHAYPLANMLHEQADRWLWSRQPVTWSLHGRRILPWPLARVALPAARGSWAILRLLDMPAAIPMQLKPLRPF